MRSIAWVFAVLATLAACAATPAPTASLPATSTSSPGAPFSTDSVTPKPTREQVLTLDNRGGPAFDIYIDGRLAAEVQCGDAGFIEASDWPLPWSLTLVRVGEQSPILLEHVSQLPAWITQFGTKIPALAYHPVIGPVPDCPSPAAETPSPSRSARP